MHSFADAASKSLIAYSTTFTFPENLSYDHYVRYCFFMWKIPGSLYQRFRNALVFQLIQRNATFVPSFWLYCTLNFVLMSFIFIYFLSEEPSSGGDSLMSAEEKKDGYDTMVSPCKDEDAEHKNIISSLIEEPTSDLDVALSSMGQVKIRLSCSSVLGNWIFNCIAMVKL